MGRLLRLKEDATPTVLSLLNTAGVIGSRGGLGPRELQEEHIVRSSPAASSEVAETYTLNVRGSSQDDVASTLQSFFKLLRMAAEFDENPSATTPVYFEDQHLTETGARYAFCYGLAKHVEPDLFDLEFELDARIEGLEWDLRREHPWRGIAPGTTPSPLTLTKTSGSVDKSSSHIAGMTVASPYGRPTHIFNYDASAGSPWSANLFGTANFDIWSVAGSTPAAGDIHYVGGDYPFFVYVWPLDTAGNYSADVIAEIWTGAAWTELTASQIAIYAHGSAGALTVDTLFQSTGENVVSIAPPETWAKTTINTFSKYWIRYRLVSVTSWTTTPNTHATETDYAQTKNYFEISNVRIGGDTFPRLDFRFFAPTGGGASPAFSTVSRILVGVRSKNLSKFEAFLWPTDRGNSADWTTALGTDTTSVTDVRSPTEKVAQVSYATAATITARVSLTGTTLLDDYRGRYLVLLFAEQNGGTAGDTSGKVRFYLGSTSGPYSDTKEKSFQSVDKGFEALDLGYVRLPFGRDILGDALGIDLVAQILTARKSGAATSSILGLALVPVDEWAFALDDVKALTTSGAGSLKGASGVEADFGVLLDRVTKFSRVASTVYPASDIWTADAAGVRISPATGYRFFAFPLTYGSGGFGVAPLFLAPGSHLAVEVRAVNSYLSLRGGG